MATPRGAIHRDLEQRFRDLEIQVRSLTSMALRRDQLGVTQGDFAVDGGGSVVVQDGGNVRVQDGGNVQVEGGRLSVNYPDGTNALRAWRDSDGAMTFMVLNQDGRALFQVSTNSAGSSFTAEPKTVSLQAAEQASIGWNTTHYVVCDPNGTTVAGNLTLPNSDVHAQSLYSDNPTTTSSSANVFMGASGQLKKVTSSLRYKQDVEATHPDPDALLTLEGKTWRDRAEVAEDPDTERRYVGLIAEELHDAGLTEYVEYDDQGRPDAIAYDRLCVPLLEVAKRQRDELADLREQVAGLAERLDRIAG